MGYFDRFRILLGFRNGYDLEGSPKQYGLWMGGRDVRAWLEPETVWPWHFNDLDHAWGWLKRHQVYITDEKKFQANEHWQSVEEYQQTFQGDCEDSAIWLASVLLRLNYSVRCVVGFLGNWEKRCDRKKRGFELYNHVWVMVALSGKQFIMESTNKKAKPVRADVTPHYIPVYSFDKTTVWEHKEKG